MNIFNTKDIKNKTYICDKELNDIKCDNRCKKLHIHEYLKNKNIYFRFKNLLKTYNYKNDICYKNINNCKTKKKHYDNTLHLMGIIQKFQDELDAELKKKQLEQKKKLRWEYESQKILTNRTKNLENILSYNQKHNLKEKCLINAKECIKLIDKIMKDFDDNILSIRLINEEIKEQQIQEFWKSKQIIKDQILTKILSNTDINKEKKYWRYYNKTNNKEFIKYLRKLDKEFEVKIKKSNDDIVNHIKLESYNMYKNYYTNLIKNINNESIIFFIKEEYILTNDELLKRIQVDRENCYICLNEKKKLDFIKMNCCPYSICKDCHSLIKKYTLSCPFCRSDICWSCMSKNCVCYTSNNTRFSWTAY